MNDTMNGDNNGISSGMISGINKQTKVSGDDLVGLRSALLALNTYTNDELDEFVRFCQEEEYGEDQLVDDIEVFEEGDSAIIENIANLFNWNSGKAAGFVNSLRKILGLEAVHKRASSYATLGGVSFITPNGGGVGGGKTAGGPSASTTSTATSGGGSIEIPPEEFEQHEIDTLPKLHEFIIPESIMKRKTGRSLDDIQDCFAKNNISTTIIDSFRDFCHEEKCDEFNFEAITHGTKLKKEMPQIGALLTGYVEKCQYELRVPTFKPSTFTKQDEKKESAYMEKECPGIIKHDRDLLRYFLLTKATERDLSALLIDIVDRISVDDAHPLDLKTFTSKPFFKHLNKSQTSMIKNGLRTYHNRFFPRLTMNPLSLICDKISDFQKYSCILSNYVQRIIDENIIKPPTLIDFLIIPPGVYNKILNNFTAEKCINLGDIQQHLDDFKTKSYSILKGKEMGGLTDNENNFNFEIMKKIVNNLFEATKKLILSLNKKQYQRITIVIDRRWRINSRKHCLYNKLRCVHTNEIYNHKIINQGTYDYNEYLNDPGLTQKSGVFDQDDDDDDDDDDFVNSGGLFGNDGTQIDFTQNEYKSFLGSKTDKITNDTIYIYQPNPPSKRKLNEFDSNFCHETLMYLTKQCIIPRKKSTIAQFHKATGKQYVTPKSSKPEFIINGNDDEYSSLTHLTGDSADGYIFNLAVHIYKPYPNDIWYKYKLKWYLFTQSASIRVSQSDFNKFWPKYFVDAEKDIHKLTDDEIKKKYFSFDLMESDTGFKRWYHAIRRTLH